MNTNTFLARDASASELPLGLWLRRGYGLLLEVADDRVQAWDVSPAGRLARDTDELLRGPREVHRDGDRAFTLRRHESITAYCFERIDDLEPAWRRLDAGDDPVLNFDVLWHAFDQDYAFFEARGVDWRRQRALYRPQVTSDTPPAELFTVLAQMLDPLDDRHVRLVGNRRMANTGWGPILQPLVREFEAEEPASDLGSHLRGRLQPYHEASLRRYLGARARGFGPNLVAGRLDETTGYLSVARLYGFAGPESDWATNRAVGRSALAEAFEHLRGVKRMILDLRLNGGGDDALALEIAGRFTDAPRPGFRKWPGRLGPAHAQSFAIRPAEGARFPGPLVVLISNVTVSAGENLAMMLKTYPNAALVGERTASVHSDVLEKTLPNGWSVTLSNEVFENSDGIVYEAKGVPPAVEAAFFTPSLIAGGPDPGVEAALQLLDRLS